jgi:hypothetical protein
LACSFEIAARWIFDFPLHGADREVGYYMLPDQSGSFLLQNDWVFDHDGLGTAAEFTPSHAFDVLLTGDSIVYGGNPLAQREKLGPVLQDKTGWHVWPAAAGSWSLQNELAFLRRKPHLVRGADIIVFVVNAGDFGEPSSWKSPYTHPRERPTFFLSYLYERYVANVAAPERSPLPVLQRDIRADWTRFIAAADKPILVIGYAGATGPRGCDWLPDWLAEGVTLQCYDPLTRYGSGVFRDEIHPNAVGTVRLADEIIQAINNRRSQQP